MRYKYPRTYHVPASPGATNDDRIVKSLDHLIGKLVVVTEKMDGECTSLYNDYFHARSLDGNSHPSQAWIKRLQGDIGYKIPEGIRICGENLFAKHSIAYNGLPDYFLAFSVWEGEMCLSWADTKVITSELGLTLVPVIYEGILSEDLLKNFFSGQSACGGEQEGYVIRLASEFKFDDFKSSVAKWVRPNHVQENGKHWAQSEVIQNTLT